MNSTKKTEVKHLLCELMAVPEEEREAEILEILDRLSPDPAYLDYIYNSMEFYDDNDNLNIDAVIEKIFSYNPIQL